MPEFSSSHGAVFSKNREYRYALWRNWSPGGNRVLFVGLNPSTADETHDDPTIRRCLGYAREWDYDGLIVGNLFAWRATRPEDLRSAAQPVGAENLEWLVKMHRDAALTVVCWGNHGSFMDQDRSVMAFLQGPQCLETNLGGAPSHPLYLKKSLRPRNFSLL